MYLCIGEWGHSGKNPGIEFHLGTANFAMTQRFKVRRVFPFCSHDVFSFEKYYLSNIVELSSDDKGGQRG